MGQAQDVPRHVSMRSTSYCSCWLENKIRREETVFPSNVSLELLIKEGAEEEEVEEMKSFCIKALLP